VSGRVEVLRPISCEPVVSPASIEEGVLVRLVARAPGMRGGGGLAFVDVESGAPLRCAFVNRPSSYLVGMRTAVRPDCERQAIPVTPYSAGSADGPRLSRSWQNGAGKLATTVLRAQPYAVS
jgi:hypothetical protein